jgi:hypothetical protein
MRKLVPYIIPPIAFFAAAVLAAPGVAQKPEARGSAYADLCPPGACPGPVLICQPAQCPLWADDYTAFLDEPLADAGDASDDYANGWSSCVINNGAIYAFNIADPALPEVPAKANATGAQGPSSPLLTENTACLARVGTHHGTTYYKHMGPAALTRFGGPVTYGGNYGHKYDHEMTIRHCGGSGDADCNEELYLTNKTGSRAWADNYCAGILGYCPNASYVNVQRGRPHCRIEAGLGSSPGRIRNDCWYVY